MSVSNGRMSRRQFVRRTFAVATSAGFVSALSACAPASPPAAVPAAQATEKPPEAAPTVAPAAGGEATRIVWYNNGDPVRNAWEEDVVKKYAEIAPDTKVELMIVPWDEFEPKMAALLASGQPPDVWSEWGSSGFMDYYHRGMLFDQTEFAKRDAAELEIEAYEPKLIEMFKVDGKLYGIPMFNLHSEVYYNKKIFDDAGIPYPTVDWEDKTWTTDTITDLALKLTKPDDDPTKAIWGLEVAGYMHICAPWLWGKDFFGPNYGEEAYSTGIATQVIKDDPDIVAAYQWMADLRCKYKVHPTPAANQALSALGGAFASGKLAMTYNGGWMWWVNKPITEFEWGVAAGPYGPVSNLNTMFTDPWFMAKTTANPEKTWQFVKYTLSDEGLLGLITGLGCMPAKKTMMDPFIQRYLSNMKAEDITKVTDGGLKYGQESPNHRLLGFDQIQKILDADLSKLWLCEVTAAEMMPGMTDRLEAAIKSASATM